MNTEEIFKESEMTYEELINYLIQKYGPAQYDYFKDDIDFHRETKVTRSEEGLYCHHIDEDKANNLSDSNYAMRAPFDWQKKDRLVYCNLIEHLLLHIKIVVRRQHGLINCADDVYNEFDHIQEGIKLICLNIKKVYHSIDKSKKAFSVIADNYKDFVNLLVALFEYMQQQIVSEESEKRLLKVGSSINFRNEEYTIVGISDNGKEVLANDNSQREIGIPIAKLYKYLSARDKLEIYKMVLFQVPYGTGPIDLSIYHDMQAVDCHSEEIQQLVKGLSKDFRGFGYPMFSKMQLDKKEYGAKSIDEYVSYALPPFTEGSIDFSNKEPHMWKGAVPESILYDESIFFVVRIEASFKLKNGQKPCVRQRKPDRYHNLSGLFRPTTCNRKGQTLLWDDENNAITKMGKWMYTSDYYDKKNDTYHSTYTGNDGIMRPFTVELTLTYEDLILFDERYDISVLNYLDGCYFLRRQNK